MLIFVASGCFNSYKFRLHPLSSAKIRSAARRRLFRVQIHGEGRLGRALTRPAPPSRCGGDEFCVEVTSPGPEYPDLSRNAIVLTTAARDCSNSGIVRLARRALANIIAATHSRFMLPPMFLGIPESARPFHTSWLIIALPPLGRRQMKRATLRASKACRSKAQRRNWRTIGPRDRSSHR